VRIFLPLLGLTFCFLVAPPLPAQVPDPGAAQDEEAAREKLLKASDQLDNIQANSEATKNSVDGMKTDVATLQATVTKLQGDNDALKQQLTELQAAFDQYKAEQLQARQTLIDNVAAMIASSKSSTKTAKKKKEAPEATAETSPPTAASAPPPNPALAPPPDPTSPASESSAGGDSAPAPPKSQKGYYHVVASGETLTMICTAYRDNGVHVTVAEIRKANGLTEDSELKAGQKLFIPKPGT
jgi:multidrug efflux pump subunit AcrA (membrane-fusion protein)